MIHGQQNVKFKSFLDYLTLEDEDTKILCNAKVYPPTQRHILEELTPLLNPTSKIREKKFY
jgi:hypothetical protein